MQCVIVFRGADYMVALEGHAAVGPESLPPPLRSNHLEDGRPSEMGRRSLWSAPLTAEQKLTSSLAIEASLATARLKQHDDRYSHS